MESNDTIYHYGVKGMKWGVRRYVRNDENVKKARKQYNRDFNNAAKAASKTKTFAITKRGKAKKQQRDAEYDKAFSKMVESRDKLVKAENKAKAKAKRQQIKKNDKVTRAYKSNLVVSGMNAVNSLLKDKDVVSAALYARQANRYRKGLAYYRDISS